MFNEEEEDEDDDLECFSINKQMFRFSRSLMLTCMLVSIYVHMTFKCKITMRTINQIDLLSKSRNEVI